MRAGGARWGAGLALALATVVHAAEVRVLSGPGATTTITLGATPDVDIDDRTPGAQPALAGQGPASRGETFTGELTLFLRPAVAGRPAAIEVGDALVSAVRLFPESDGTTVTVFVRQPVLYTVSRPSALGDVRIELRTRARPLTVQPGRRGEVKAERPPSGGEQEVAVDAESLAYDQQTNTLTARGGVTLSRGDTTLTADEVVYDRTNGVAEARGHVVLRDPQATVDGDFAHLNLQDESGWVEHATALLEPTRFTLAAGRLEKQGGPRYSVADGVFTTCECGGLDRPSWSIAGKQTDIRLQGIGVMRGMTFRVKDRPVLYLPYFVFPANTERQSGLLIPRVGYSNRRGFEIEQPFFWAINKSSDATVAIDLESRARLGMIGEYRYALSRRTRGQFLAAYYSEQIRGRSTGTVEDPLVPADVPENRFMVSGHHVMPFYEKSRFYLDLMAVSDNSFLRDINSFAFSTRQDLALRSTRYTTSRTGVIRTWADGLAWIENAYFQDLRDPQELAVQRLPRVTVEHGEPLLGDRVVGRLFGEATDFQREDGADGLRLDFGPEVFVPARLGRVLFGSVTGRLRETAYHLTDQEQVALQASPFGKEFRVAPELPDLETNPSRELAEVNARLGSQVQRVFAFRHFGLDKVKHTIEPEVQYLFVPQVGRPMDERQITVRPCAGVRNPVPGVNCDVGATLFGTGLLFDERDAINRRNFVSYGITTRLLGRAGAPSAVVETDRPPGGPVPTDTETLPQGLPAGAVPGFVGPPPPPSAASPPRELLRASILQGYDVSRQLVGESHLSDVDLGIRFTPVEYLGLSYNTTVNLDDSTIRGFTLGGVLREPWWAPANAARNYQSPSTVGLSYRFIEKSVNRQDIPETSPESLLFSTAGVNEVDASVYIRLGDYLGFTFLSRYDLNTTKVSPTEEIGPHFLERDYFLRLISRCNCWVLEAGMADKTNPDERSFRIQFTLIGLGSFGRSPATRNYVGLTPLAQLGLRRPTALGGGSGY